MKVVDMLLRIFCRSNYCYLNYYRELNFSFSLSVRPTLAWLGRCLLDGISPSDTVLSKCFFQMQNLQIVLHNLVQVLCYLLPVAQSITKLLHLLTQFTVSILFVWPNHLRRISRITTEMFCITSLSGISSEGLHSDRLMLHNHLVICIPVRWGLQVSSILTGHVSLPYKIAILTQAFKILPFMM